ncbi:Tetraacyldisaccharide 4'-kinase [Alphaproteobacteria bacterium SO-S41]|nr:Tetraacyldisaccharide 4'-kinase [Alphaproteobacteria bacterium SO-S41]
MRPPEFWSRPPGKPGLTARLLSPIAAIYGWVVRARLKRPPQLRPTVPVICVGNLTLGGAGKTPVAIAILERLSAMRASPVALSRGYGGSLQGPVVVEPDHRANEVGDEPLLLARHAPTIIAKDRAAGARACLTAGAGIIVMDDGFQNPSVAKDLSIAVVDSESGFGNGRVFPAGPMRETARDGLMRADAVILMGRGKFDPGHPKTLRANLRAPLSAAFDGRRVVAFAGIGRPEKFFKTLEKAGAEIVAVFAFPDHHAYDDDDMERMRALATARGANLATTEKDFVRLSPRMRRGVLTLPVEARFEDERALDALLLAALAHAHTAG